MAVDVHRHRAYRPVLHLVVEAAAGHQLLQLTPALGHLEPAVLDLLEAMVAREIVGAVTAEEDVRPLLEEPAGEADRRAGGAQAGDGAGRTSPSVHDRGIELDAAGGGQHAAASGIEARV